MPPRVRPNNFGFEGKMRGEGGGGGGEHDTAIFAMLHLKVLLTVWFYKILNLSFLNQLSWPKTRHAEH